MVTVTSFSESYYLLQDVEPPLNSGVYTLYCQPQCGFSCLKSVAITVIWVALTASRGCAAITSFSFPLAALFSPNLLHAVWLAVKWWFLFSFEVPTGLGSRGNGPYKEMVWKLLCAFLQPSQAVQFTPGRLLPST